MLPSEFIASFEEQYPKQELSYELPESLDKCPALKEVIVRNIEHLNELTLIIMDEGHVKYDMLSRTYVTLDNPVHEHKITNRGYEIMFERLYKKYAGNLSPKTFAFIIDDLVELNPTLFRAGLVAQQGSYGIEKAIMLNQSWIKFCMEYPSKFKMDFSDYEKVIAKLEDDKS